MHQLVRGQEDGTKDKVLQTGSDTLAQEGTLEMTCTLKKCHRAMHPELHNVPGNQGFQEPVIADAHDASQSINRETVDKQGVTLDFPDFCVHR